MATHPHETHDERRRPDDYPRNLERQRHRDVEPETLGPDGSDGPDGGVMRSEPVAARAGNGNPDPPHSQAHDGDGDRLIRASESEELRRRWESIQASFIDSPRESVEEADRLVGELTDRIAERFRSERSGLDAQWERGDDVSTEDLRLTLQRYRGFFDRLLHL